MAGFAVIWGGVSFAFLRSADLSFTSIVSKIATPRSAILFKRVAFTSNGRLQELHIIRKRLEQRRGQQLDFLQRSELRVGHFAIHAIRLAFILSTQEDVRLNAGVRLHRTSSERDQLFRADAELFFSFAERRLLRRLAFLDVTAGATNQAVAELRLSGSTQNLALRDHQNAYTGFCIFFGRCIPITLDILYRGFSAILRGIGG